MKPLGLAALYITFAMTAPQAVGLWQDDAIYTITANRWPRDLDLPGLPFLTKYPGGYPALLALGSLVSNQFPGNLPLLLFIPDETSARHRSNSRKRCSIHEALCCYTGL